MHTVLAYLEIWKWWALGTFQVYILKTVHILAYFFTLKISTKSSFYIKWGAQSQSLLNTPQIHTWCVWACLVTHIVFNCTEADVIMTLYCEVWRHRWRIQHIPRFALLTSCEPEFQFNEMPLLVGGVNSTADFLNKA